MIDQESPKPVLEHNEEDSMQNQKDFMNDISRKKIIIRYKEQNEALRVQLKQLNERLNTVLQKQSIKLTAKNKLPALNTTTNNDQIIKKQLQNVYKILEINKKQLKYYKDMYKQDHHQRIKLLQDQLKQKQIQNQQLKKEVKNFAKLQKISPGVDESQQQKQMREHFDDLNAEVTRLKKIIRDFEKQKSQKDKELIKKQQYMISLEQKNRQLLLNKKPVQAQKEEKKHDNSASTITHMDLNQENWNFIKSQYLLVKQAKINQQMKFKAQISQLKSKISVLQKTIQILKVRQPKPTFFERNKSQKKNSVDIKTSIDNALISNHNNSITIDIEQNDKNFNPQKLNQSLHVRNISKDSDLQSLQAYTWGKGTEKKWSDVKFFRQYKDIKIIGGTVWFSDFLLGLRFNYKSDNKILYTEQHVILRTKQYTKNQFQFQNSSYLQNVILNEQDGKLIGITFVSNENKVIQLGKKTGKSIDLNIKSNERPVYAFGHLGTIIDINKHEKSSVVTSLGFQALVI